MFAAVVIPDFSLHAILRHEPELAALPVALLQDDSKKARICQLTAAARKSGASAGLTSTQAKARCGSIVFRIRSEAQESAAQEVLLECTYRSAAFIESTAPGVCTMDLRGLESLRAGGAPLAAWARELIGRLDQLGLPARIGAASAPGLAWQAAQVADLADPFLEIADAEMFWRKLPIDLLGPEPGLADVLRKWGILTAAQFLELGKDRIAERLGQAGLALFDATRSDAPRPLRLTAPREIYEELFEFAQPVETLEPLLFMVRRFLEQLCRRVEHAALVVQKLELRLLLESGNEHARTLEIPAPNRQAELLFRIVHNYLENVRTDSPVKGLAMRAHPTAAETQQFQLFETAIRDPNHFYETIGRLGALLGPDRVGTPMVEATHKPDDVRMAAVRAEAAKPAEAPIEKQLARGLMLRRFRPPLPAGVRLRETTPIFVSSPRVTGSIVRSAGPWRISGQWWENSWQREEWDVQTKEGGLYRLFRDGKEWFVEGAYD